MENDSVTQSRMLTKRQLADMAYGVRELSKRLGSVRLRLKVKTVFLLTKAHDESLIGHTKEMVEWLLSKERDTPYIVYDSRVKGRIFVRLMLSRYVEDTLEHNHRFDARSIISADTSREGRLRYWNNELCAKHPLTFDIAVTVLCPRTSLRSYLIHVKLGGDGTLLYASWLFQRIVPPVLSFSLGSYGTFWNPLFLFQTPSRVARHVAGPNHSSYTPDESHCLCFSLRAVMLTSKMC